MENIDTLLAAVAQTQGFEDEEPVLPTANEPGLGETSELPTVVREGSESLVVATVPPKPRRVAGEKKKRGRAYGQLAAKSPAAKRIKPEDEEEDVCFICFDGGSLVLCDCKGCPKAYHPACIKRDESFFQSTAKWYCGWHICSVCRKASHYLCYTCSYSLCKGCAKDADYSCVRKNKGFCSICMKTIMLLENKDQANNESIQVDFDDITSWEYLFKVYWVALRDKLSLTLDELTQAQKPWNDMDTIVRKPPSSSNYISDAASLEVPISDSTTELSELNMPRADADIDVDKLNDKDGANPSMDERATDIPCVKEEATSEPEKSPRKTEWATNDLLELVAHMKNGDTSPMEPFDVERLLLDYVKRYNLRDPLKKAHVICDQRLRNMFGGKVRVGHFEMLKLLHSHFLVKDPSMDERATDIPCIKEEATSEPEKSRVKVRTDCSSSSTTEWATKDLLELVAHMKNGDTSPMEPFDVERLLLDYVKRYNLRDPLKKAQVICDQRLRNMFGGKVRVGHFEMLKILHSHFLVEEPEKSCFIPAGPVSSIVKSEMEVDGNTDGLPLPLNSKTRKTRKKSDEKALTLVNLNEYAAIDVHNINLIYLRRKLMEDLIKDHDDFNNMVIGSIVRIIISSNDQKQDVHRLVQVVGTAKSGEPYKICDGTSDVMLEVLNLDRKEVVPITAISNNEFTEDECIQLRQSIRCGLLKRFIVGEVQNIAMSLQPVRVNDCLEAEITELIDLRDQSSENARTKELRGIVSKLRRLKSPGEHSHRISKIPEIHTDPKMSPTYESKDTKSGDNSEKASYSDVPQKGRKPISSNKKDKERRITRARSRAREKPNASGSSSSDKQTNQLIITNAVAGCGNNQPMQSPGLETLAATTSIGNSSSSSVIETEKLWHYRDPNGKIQGPFAMMQLRKWSATGLFPSGMTIWTNHEQYDSLLLTFALNGNFNVASDSPHSKVQEEEEATGEIGLLCEVTNVNSGDSKPTEPGLGSNNKVSVSSDLPPPLSPNKMHEDSHHPRLPQNGEKDSTVVTEENLIIPDKPELQNQSNNEDHVGLPSKENLRSMNFHLSSNDTECESVRFAPDPDKPTGDISLLDLSSPTPRTLEIDQLDVAMQSFELLELLSPTPKPNNENQLATEAKQSEFINFPVTNSGPMWSGASGLVEASEVQLPGVADKFCGYSPTPAQPPMPSENVSNFTPNEPNWQVTINDIIEIDAFEEETVSDLFDEAAAREASFPSPTSAIKFARELEDCKDNDCFSSIEELSRKSDAFSFTSEPSVPCKPISFTTLDIPTSSSVHSSASNEGETINNAPVYSGEAGSSEFHPRTSAENDALDVVGANVGIGLGSDSVDPGRGSTTVQGNINLVTVQGNVNLVLSQGMPGLGWETNQGTGWANPWDGQRMYPREWGGYQVGRPPRGRQPQYGSGGQQQYGGGGGYSRQIPKGQRVCKFYESGHCKKGAFCNYLHP